MKCTVIKQTFPEETIIPEKDFRCRDDILKYLRDDEHCNCVLLEGTVIAMSGWFNGEREVVCQG